MTDHEWWNEAERAHALERANDYENEPPSPDELIDLSAEIARNLRRCDCASCECEDE